jgi:hypothetical protein
VTHPLEHTSAIHDVMAAELLASAARTDPEAAELKGSLNALLGAAFIHNERCNRLNDAAVQATLGGAHDAAAVIAGAAQAEREAAMEHEALISGAVRGMHSFGYMTADEQKFIRRKKFEEGMTSGQAEDVFSKILDNMFQSAVNFGSDADGFGGDESDTAEEPEEMDNGAFDRMGVVFAALGGDFPLVFGADAYDRFKEAFGASADRLIKRRARLRARLKKLQEKLQTLEKAGKSGLRVRFLERRVGKLEDRIEKISSKIKSAKGAKGAADDSADEAEETDRAESSAAKYAAKGDDDAELDSIESIASELDEDDSETDDEDDEGGLDDEDDDEINGLVAEVSLFGASPRRTKRLERRVKRLEARLNKLVGRRRGLLKNRRVRRLRARLAKLKAKLRQMDEQAPAAFTPPTASAGSYVNALTSPLLSAYKPDEYIAVYKGSLNVQPEVAEREPYVQFFRRKAESMGSLNIESDRLNAENEGFFARIGKFFRETFTAKGREERRQRQGRSRSFLQNRAANIQARRAEATLRRSERVERRQLRRSGVVTDSGSLRPGMWMDGAGNTFSVIASGKIYLVQSRKRSYSPPRLIPDQETARANLIRDGKPLNAEYNPVALERARKTVLSRQAQPQTLSAGRWDDGAGNVLQVAPDGKIYLIQSGKQSYAKAPRLVGDQVLAQQNLLRSGRQIG